jgi:hypothetical protein
MPNRDFCSPAVRQHIKKLSLAPGDVLIVSNEEILKQLQRMPAMSFYVPVVFSADGSGLSKASREQILEILERIDEAQAVAEGIT